MSATALRFMQHYYNQSVPDSNGESAGDGESVAAGGMQESFAMGAPIDESDLPPGEDDAPSEDERSEDEPAEDDAPIEAD